MVFGLIDLDRIEQILSFAGPIAAGVLILRLWTEGLLRQYRIFALYLLCVAAEIPVLLTINRMQNRYFLIYVSYESLMWLLQVCVVIDLFSRVVRQFPGIARSGRNYMTVAITTAFALSAAFAAIQHETGPGTFPILEHYLLIARIIAFTLLAFLGLSLGFLFWFPIPLNRNVVFYAIGFSIYFASRALTRLAGNLLGPKEFVMLSIISLGIVLGCLLFWILFLTRQGEAVQITLGHSWQPEQGPGLVKHLESLNASLLRTARK